MYLKILFGHYKFIILFLFFIPGSLSAQSTTLHLQFDTSSDLSTFDNRTIQFFLPIGKFFNNYTPSYGHFDQKEKTVDITFDMQGPTFIKLNSKGVYYLYAEPGDKITANSHYIDGRLNLSFTGKHSAANNLYNNVLTPAYRETLTLNIEQKLDSIGNKPSIDFQETSTPQFSFDKKPNLISYIDSEWSKTLEPFKKLYANGELSQNGIDYFTTALHVDFFSRPLLRIIPEAMDNNQLFSSKYIYLLDHIFNKGKQNNDFILRCKNAFSYLSGLGQFEKLIENPKSNLSEFDVFKIYKHYGALNKDQQEFFYAQLFFVEKMLGMNEFDVKESLKIYQQLYPRSAFLPILQSAEQEIYSAVTIKKTDRTKNKQVNPEELAIIINFDDKGMSIDSASVTTLKALIKNYSKSSPIFIDFWATWCVPCIIEFANAKETNILLSERKIHPVYISIDKVEVRNRWIEIIQTKKLFGTHILASKELKNELLNIYKINGIPRYMVVDINNNIVDKEAPRPSDRQKLIKILNQVRQ